MTVILVVRRRRPETACWLLLPALVVAQALFVAHYPGSEVLAFGLLGIVLLGPVLGAWQAIVAAMLLWGVGVGLLLDRGALAPTQLLSSLALYALCTGAVWLAGRSLRVAVSWALTGWQRAQDMLEEARERRGELYRVLRALEEATYRIERMNNELILARSEAEEARAAKARFVSTVSHEIRGPLNLILGFSRLMALSPERYRAPLPAEYRADVVTIYRNSQHLSSLVDDILDLSQIEAERLPLIKDRMDLETEVLGEAAQIVEPLMQRKGLTLTLDLHGDLPPLLIDGVRIRQVALNLLTNAARFTDSGGVTVKTRLEQERVVVSVRDTGPGIPQENLAQLFKAFQQLPTPERSVDKGSGLGLSISKQLVELHGGEIWIESRMGAGPDTGTTVSFSLPLPGFAIAASGAIRQEARGRVAVDKDHVVVIHQDAVMVKTLGRYLEGYQVIGLPNAREVRAVIEELHPRAIIAAQGATRELEDALGGLAYDVPLIECALPRVASGAHEGILGYLVKPVSGEMLAAVIKQVPWDGELTILLVDDDPDALRLIEMMLSALPHPYRICKAYEGAQALEIMAEVTPDLVLVDLLMPGMGGEDLIAHMQADERLAQVPVVIVSARDWSEEALTVGLPLAVHRRRALPLSDAAQCLLALLKEVGPRYLPEPARAATSAPTPPR
jgi:signal transduction histidine kinase/CheY-like chemotaxis protein